MTGWDCPLSQSYMKAIYFEGEIEDNYLGHIMAEVWKDKVYAPYLEGKENLIIVDVGANVGLTTLYFSKFAKKVYSVEPSEKHMNCLKAMLKSNGLEEKVVPIQKAIFNHAGKFPMGGPVHNHTMRSLHMATWETGTSDEMVETITLPELFKGNDIEKVDFMKLDIEGSEFEVLGHSSFKEVAPLIKTMLVEVHAWGGRNPDQAADALEVAGFTKVTKIPNDASLIVAEH